MVEETQLPPALRRGGAVLGRWLGGWALSARPALRSLRRPEALSASRSGQMAQVAGWLLGA